MKKNKGFTLIELLVVISLIGILTGIAAINLIGVRGRARDAERKSDLNTIRSAFELFRADNGAYPLTPGEFNIANCNNPFQSGGATYIQSQPCDPLGGSWPAYTYVPASPPLTYTMTACLENANDPDGAGACGTNGEFYTVRNP